MPGNQINLILFQMEAGKNRVGHRQEREREKERSRFREREKVRSRELKMAWVAIVDGWKR